MLNAKHGKTNATSGAGKPLNLQSIIRSPKSFHRPQSVTSIFPRCFCSFMISMCPNLSTGLTHVSTNRNSQGFSICELVLHQHTGDVRFQPSSVVLELIEVRYWTGMLCNGFFSEILVFSMLPRPDEWKETRTRKTESLVAVPWVRVDKPHSSQAIKSRTNTISLSQVNNRTLYLDPQSTIIYP